MFLKCLAVVNTRWSTIQSLSCHSNQCVHQSARQQAMSFNMHLCAHYGKRSSFPFLVQPGSCGIHAAGNIMNTDLCFHIPQWKPAYMSISPVIDWWLRYTVIITRWDNACCCCCCWTPDMLPSQRLLWLVLHSIRSYVPVCAFVVSIHLHHTYGCTMCLHHLWLH